MEPRRDVFRARKGPWIAMLALGLMSGAFGVLATVGVLTERRMPQEAKIVFGVVICLTLGMCLATVLLGLRWRSYFLNGRRRRDTGPREAQDTLVDDNPAEGER